MSSNWAEQIGKNLFRQVDIKIGENQTIIYNLGEGKTVQFDYQNDKCVNVEHRDEKLEKDMNDMINELRLKKK